MSEKIINPKISVTKLKDFPYPNLVAEYFESGYHICTLADHMGLSISQEDCDFVKRKLEGVNEILYTEALGLARLFSVDLNYLFDHELKVFSGESLAYWRWLESNQKKVRELKEMKERKDIEIALRENPELFEFMKLARTLNVEEVEHLTEYINQRFLKQ